MEHSPRFLALVQAVMPQVTEISAADVQKKLAQGDDFDFIDVREDHEWAAGHARGARHLGRGVLERDVEKAIPDVDREIVLYCGGGFRSALAAINLKAMGYTKVLSLRGGFRAWKDAGGALD